MGIISWIRKSFCVSNMFHIDYELSPNPRQNVAPVLFRNIGSPYLRHENFDESIELIILKSHEDQGANYANKMTQTIESNENCEIGYTYKSIESSSSVIPFGSCAKAVQETDYEDIAYLNEHDPENIYIDDDYYLEGEQKLPSNLLLFSSFQHSASKETANFSTYDEVDDSKQF